MQIRKATQQDASALAALSIEVWTHTYCKDGIPARFATYVLETFSPSALLKLINDPKEHLYVAHNGENLRGYIRLTEGSSSLRSNRPRGEITTLYVRARHQGSGIGKALLNVCHENARALGIKDVFLKVNAENESAIRFYLGQNFQQTDEDFFELDGERYLNLVLEAQIVPHT